MTLLAIETEIIARLKAQITGAQVASGAAVAGAAVDVATLAPLILVQPADASVESISHDGTGVVEEQNWVTSVVMSLTPDADGTLLNDYSLVDTMISAVVVALSGYVSLVAMGPFSYTGRDVPTITAGLIEVPLRFSVRVFSQA